MPVHWVEALLAAYFWPEAESVHPTAASTG